MGPVYPAVSPSSSAAAGSIIVGMSDEHLRRLPKVELHRHLDGSVRVETIWEIAQANSITLGARSLAELRERAVIRTPMESLDAVLASFATQQSVLCSFDAISRITFENVEDAWRDGAKLVELRFAPAFIAEGKQLSNDDIIAGVLDGMQKGMAAYPIEVGLIGILPRTFPPEKNARATRDLVRWRASGAPGAERICGFDLADREAGIDPSTLSPFVETAREAGMGITIHSGENTDAAHVHLTLDRYRPRRIGHGIQAARDGACIRRLIEGDVLLEVCPSSNWLTRSVPSLALHPLPALVRAGVPVCLNSDDPNLFGIDLVTEYVLCAREYGMAEPDFRAMNLAALRHSFLPEAVKARVAAAHFGPRG
jgi:adenosine deaminase